MRMDSGKWFNKVVHNNSEGSKSLVYVERAQQAGSSGFQSWGSLVSFLLLLWSIKSYLICSVCNDKSFVFSTGKT